MRIAFTGNMQAGKTTCARMIDADVRLCFAEPLKAALLKALVALGCSYNTVHRHLYIEKTPESRRLMQAFGNYARSIDPDVWVRPVCDKIDQLEMNANITIDDLRFINEADALRKRGFSITKILRKGFDGDSDKSERELAHIRTDFTIDNDGSFGELKIKVSEIVKEIICVTS